MFYGYPGASTYWEAWGGNQNLRHLVPLEPNTVDLMRLQRGLTLHDLWQELHRISAKIPAVGREQRKFLKLINGSHPIDNKGSRYYEERTPEELYQYTQNHWFSLHFVLALAKILDVDPVLIIDEFVYYAAQQWVQNAGGFRLYYLLLAMIRMGKTPREACPDVRWAPYYFVTYFSRTDIRFDKASPLVRALLRIAPAVGLRPADLFIDLRQFNPGVSAYYQLGKVFGRLSETDALFLVGVSELLLATELEERPAEAARAFKELWEQRKRWEGLLNARRLYEERG